jgi:hypothetical protein
MGQVARSLALYKTFNAREPDFVTALSDLTLPDRLALLGTAKQILYRSDKWRSDGKASSYVHPYESDVKCYVPWQEGVVPVTVRAWPGELVQLGHCIELEIETPDKQRLFVRPQDGTLLCATPDGRTLVLLHLQFGLVGALTGGRQRVTDRGVEDG